MHPHGMISMEEQAYLQLAGLQHFLFCRRQWALIHVEQQWSENVRTVEGMLMHERAHDEAMTEKRGNLLITRGMPVVSHRMGIAGKCDVVEFHADEQGVSLHGRAGRWLPMPVEYKRGNDKEHDADRAQLCAQVLCLEEMLCCDIPQGALYYGETRRRTAVPFTEELRRLVVDSFAEMHQYNARGYTPKVRPKKGCRSCSLQNLCLPALIGRPSVETFLEEHL